MNENEFIFEFQYLNRYNFNNIFRIYDIYNSFCILFGGNIIKYNLHNVTCLMTKEEDYLELDNKIPVSNLMSTIKCGI